jgi:hypothetical protein
MKTRPEDPRTTAFSKTLCFLFSLSLTILGQGQQTFPGQTTIDGSLWVNPPTVGTNAITLQGAAGTSAVLDAGQFDLLSPVSGSSHQRRAIIGSNGLYMNLGREASATESREDWNAYIGLSHDGSFPGLKFYTDQILGTGTSNAITVVSALHYTWHRPVTGGSLTEDIAQRSAAVMRLGGASNSLSLLHPTDSNHRIVLNPQGGTITINGRQVLTQSDYASISSGVNTQGSGYGSAAFGLDSTASGWAALTSGQGNAAAGGASAAVGAWSYAGGYASMALGYWAAAVGDSSVALAGPNVAAYGTSSFTAGSWSTANAPRSMALGRGIVVTQPGQIALGSYNDFASPTLPQDLILVIGNGVEDLANMYSSGDTWNRRNALEVQATGRTTLRHKDHATLPSEEALRVLGSASVSGTLKVAGATKFSGGLSASGTTTLSGPVNHVGTLQVTGTLQVSGSAGNDGTLTAKKIRVQPGGDLPMDEDFQNNGGLGMP